MRKYWVSYIFYVNTHGKGITQAIVVNVKHVIQLCYKCAQMNELTDKEMRWGNIQDSGLRTWVSLEGQ